MKKIYFFLISMFIGALAYGQSPTIGVSPMALTDTVAAEDADTISIVISNTGNRELNWKFTGKGIDFEKDDYADISLEENQDRITNNVWITRADYYGIFNIADEDRYRHHYSPAGTKWYGGPTWDANPFTDYFDWEDEVGGDPTLYTDTFSMHLIEENRFFDVVFKSWTSGKSAGGGGFSYTRIERFNWVHPILMEGSVSPGADTTIDIIIDAADLLEGTYEGYVYIESDDDVNPYVEVPITVSVTGTPDYNVNPSSLNFGNKEIGGSETLVLEIDNFGTGTLDITDISMDSAFFSVSESNLSVNANNIYLLDVIFNPTTVKTYYDTLVITSNAGEISVPLEGIGVLAPDISVDISSFDEALVSGNTVTREIIVANSGDADLNWDIKLYTNPVTFSKEDWADWTLPENHDRISPTVALARADFQPFFNLIGENEWDGITPSGTQWAVGHSDDLTPGDYDDLGNILSSDMPEYINSPFSVYLSDDDIYIDLTLREWTGNGQGGGYLYDRDGAVYWIDRSNNTGTTIMADADTFEVTFDASGMSSGVYNADIIIRSNDPDMPEVTIPATLTVTGEPEISTITDLAFGDVYTNSSSTMVLSIDNIGTDSLEIIAASTDSVFYTLGQIPTKIAPEQSGTIEITLTPDKEGLFQDTIYISSDDPTNAIVKVALEGTGLLPPEITVDKTSLTETLQAGNSSTQTIKLKNVGDTTLVWDLQLSVSGKVSFRKPPFADFNQPENQDRISDLVWITRATRQGIFNYITEESYDKVNDASPFGTAWAWGKTADAQPGDYDTWYNTHSQNPPSMVNTFVSMHLVEENRYFDIYFTEWYIEYTGGAFAWDRWEVPEWLTSDAYNGTIVAGDSVELTITFDAALLTAGEYSAFINVVSNDASSADVEVPVDLTVTGIPDVDADTLVEFDTTEIGNVVQDLIWIKNYGTDTLIITDISNDLPEFYIETTALNVGPDDSLQLNVFFNPTIAVLYEDTFEISSNDPDEAVFKVAINGTGIEPPDVTLNMYSIDTALFADSSAVYQLIIENEGTTDLDWNIGGQIRMFTKADSADWSAPGNYDIITENVWMARKNGQGLFNYAVENGYGDGSPEGTEWAYGISGVVPDYMYEDWASAVDNNPKGMVGKDISLHLLEDDMYFDLVFHSFTGGGGGGGFSYTRTEVLPSWLSFEATTGTVSAGDKDTIEVTLDATDLSGMYMANFAVFSNDPDEGMLTVNVALEVAAILQTREIADRRVSAGFSSEVIDLAGVFIDANGDVLTIEPISDNESVVTVEISGTDLTVNAGGLTGDALISLRVSDGNGNFAYADFAFIINGIPTPENPLADTTVDEGFGTLNIDFSGVFVDPNAGDTITYSVVSSDENVVTAVISGNNIVITEVGIGSSDITISAEDQEGGTSDMFVVTVSEVVTGLANNNQSLMNVYPNPSTGIVTFELKDNTSIHIVEIINITGQVVYNEKVSGKTEIDLSGQAKGLYLINVISSKDAVGETLRLILN